MCPLKREKTKKAKCGDQLCCSFDATETQRFCVVITQRENHRGNFALTPTEPHSGAAGVTAANPWSGCPRQGQVRRPYAQPCRGGGQNQLHLETCQTWFEVSIVADKVPVFWSLSLHHPFGPNRHEKVTAVQTQKKWLHGARGDLRKFQFL